MAEELEIFARKETQKDAVVPKKIGEPLGIVVVESGIITSWKSTKV